MSATSTSRSTRPSAPPPPSAPNWRGIAAERREEVSGGLAALLRARSRRLLGSLLRPHRRALAVLAVLVVVQSVASLAGPYLIGLGIDHGVPALTRGDGPGTLLGIVGVFVGAVVIQVLALRAFLRLSGRVAQDVVLDLRRRLFRHLQHLSMSFHEEYTSGRVISRQTSDVDAIAEFLDEGIDTVVMAALSLVGIGTAMLLLDVPLALVAIAMMVPVAVLTVWFRRESASAYRAIRESVARVIVQIVETLNGIRAVQAFRREPRNEEIFGGLSEEYRSALHRSMTLMSRFGPGTRLVTNTAAALVLGVGAYRVLGGAIGIGVLTSFLLYLRRFFDPLMELSQYYNAFQSAIAALEKVSGVLTEPTAVPEPADPRPPAPAAGEIRFESVSFRYPGRTDHLVLSGLDLVIPAGQTVALVGPTGAGKSTIARLVGRFYDPTSGRVLLDGVDLRDLAEADLHRPGRHLVATVTQESFLFSGSVADNIRLGRPGAAPAEVERAARTIGAHSLFAALPHGYDTDVRKRGGRLSAGQRQLVAFARAFLADPAVLVLDEATSSLDIPSERLVHRALRTILAHRTAMVIAHRLSTVAIADRVLVVSDGRVVEDGAPSLLAARDGPYARLHRAWRESLGG